MLHVLYESAGAALQLVEPHLVCCLLPWQQRGNTQVLKVEVTRFTSTYISLAKTSHMAMPAFFLYALKEMSVNVTNSVLAGPTAITKYHKLGSL